MELKRLTAVNTSTGVCWTLQKMDGGLVVVCGMGVCKDAHKGQIQLFQCAWSVPCEWTSLCSIDNLLLLIHQAFHHPRMFTPQQRRNLVPTADGKPEAQVLFSPHLHGL